MRVAVIMPVGPGHQWVHEDAADSTKQAAKNLVRLDCVPSLDFEGKLGRSKARNIAVAAAVEADWLFFIDADDVCLPGAFASLIDAISKEPHLIAVFGAIHSDRPITDNVYPLDWAGLMKHGSYGTLSMGCFVRADIARATPFNEDLDVAEDFDFYLRLLHGRAWVKREEPLVTIRQNVPSAAGPRGKASVGWREACQAVVDRWKCPSIQT